MFHPAVQDPWFENELIYILMPVVMAHILTIKLSTLSQPSIVVISLNNHFEQFLSKQHLFCTSHFLPFVITTFDTFIEYNNNNSDEQHFLHPPPVSHTESQLHIQH